MIGNHLNKAHLMWSKPVWACLIDCGTLHIVKHNGRLRFLSQRFWIFWPPPYDRLCDELCLCKRMMVQHIRIISVSRISVSELMTQICFAGHLVRTNFPGTRSDIDQMILVCCPISAKHSRCRSRRSTHSCSTDHKPDRCVRIFVHIKRKPVLHSFQRKYTDQWLRFRVQRSK